MLFYLVELRGKISSAATFLPGTYGRIFGLKILLVLLLDRFSNHDRQSAIKTHLWLFARGAFDCRFVCVVGPSDPITKKKGF